MNFVADIDVSELCGKMSGSIPPTYNSLKLVEACPFEIVPQFKNLFVEKK